MAKVQYAFTALALAAAACSPPASETTPPQAPASAVPTGIAAVVSAAAPGITITNGEPGNNELILGHRAAGHALSDPLPLKFGQRREDVKL